MSRSLLRILGLCWALAVSATPGVLSVADALSEAASAAAVGGHVEAQGGTGCPPAHGADCAACSLLKTGMAGPSRLPAAVLGDAPALRAVRPAVALLPAREGAPAQPRAPPAV